MIFRFDDVCVNSDMQLLNDLTNILIEKFPNSEVIWAVSPMVDSKEKYRQRIFPKKWNAMSDYRQFFKMDKIGIPDLHPKVTLAGHGLVHVDHRLLDYHAQELSILLSCNLIKCDMFVPPFNKWNKDTEKICLENDIELVQFEDGWKSMEYNSFDKENYHWYLHAREWSPESFKNWFK